MVKDVKQNWKNVLISYEMTILSAIKCMDTEGLRILLVVDQDQCLQGVITDGDIRRYLLKQGNLDNTVKHIMNHHPTKAYINENRDQLLVKMQTLGILHIPIVDDQNRVIGLETYDSLVSAKTKDNWVIFMAGGMGKRLYPLTADCPKPLLKVGEKVISEILLENFIKCGFRKFIFSLNYKANMIRDYYENGSRWGVEIQYIEECDALGTAGSLSLLPERPKQSFFLINADILTNINFDCVLDFHKQTDQAQATMCVRQYQNTIPFGVVQMNEEDHTLLEIDEKPTKNYFVNAGIYILEPDALDHLVFNTYCDMPIFLTSLVKKGYRVNTFPIREYWLDIGHHDNLVRAAADYVEIFS